MGFYQKLRFEMSGLKKAFDLYFTPPALYFDLEIQLFKLLLPLISGCNAYHK